MKSSDAVVTGSPFASSQPVNRRKSSACLRCVAGRHVLPNVAVYSAISGRSGCAVHAVRAAPAPGRDGDVSQKCTHACARPRRSPLPAEGTGPTKRVAPGLWGSVAKEA